MVKQALFSIIGNFSQSSFLDAPVAWQTGFQNPATPVMEGIIWLHNYIIFFLIVVIVVVFWFLARSLYLFNESVTLFSTEFNHDPVIEAVWTVAPAIVLIAIAIPSFSLLYSMDEVVAPALTVKIVGHQWYWSYELDSIARIDPLLPYVFKGTLRDIDSIDVMRWQSRSVMKYYFTRLRAMAAAFKSARVYFHKTLVAIVWFYPERCLINLTFLVKQSQKSFVNAIYKSLASVSELERFNIINHLVVNEKVVFHRLLKPMTKSYLNRSTIEWVNPSVKFDSYMLSEDNLSLGGLRLLEVDNRLVLPVRTHVRLLITSVDVIHSWAVPSFGIKVDAIPGRLNQAALYIRREGHFYGQCSELCGVNHGFMPVNVQGVDDISFIHWIRINSNVVRLEDLVNSNWYIKPGRSSTAAGDGIELPPKPPKTKEDTELLQDWYPPLKWAREEKMYKWPKKWPQPKPPQQPPQQ